MIGDLLSGQRSDIFDLNTCHAFSLIIFDFGEKSPPEFFLPPLASSQHKIDSLLWQIAAYVQKHYDFAPYPIRLL